MAGFHQLSHLKVFLTVFVFIAVRKQSEGARVFTITNDCKTTIWPGITPGESFGGGGFPLKPGESAVFTAPVGWSGRIWGRTGCNFDRNGNGSCQTGSCGSSLKCGASGETPVTLAEFTLAAMDFYDVSLVDGFNLPMVVKPLNGRGPNCSAAGCDSDLRQNCPSELAVRADGKTVACRSACDVFNTDEYCCRGLHGNPSTCQPTYYSKKFKDACPTAYSYAYDDPTSIFTCTEADFVITFCSSRKQRVCTYHVDRLICSGSGRQASVGKWLAMVLLCFLSWLLFTSQDDYNYQFFLFSLFFFLFYCAKLSRGCLSFWAISTFKHDLIHQNQFMNTIGFYAGPIMTTFFCFYTNKEVHKLKKKT